MTQQQKRIAVFGAGGHGKVVIDAVERCADLQVAGVFDDATSPNQSVLGYPVAGGRDALLAGRSEIDAVIVAIGTNRTRYEVAQWISAQGFEMATVIHPAAVVAPSVLLGSGTLVMPGAVVNADARIGSNVIINSGAVVEHDCILGVAVHVAPNATLCGAVQSGDFVLIGAGAVVLPGTRIPDGHLVKAGTVVAQNHMIGKKNAS